jgi:hypothetical protein
MTLPVPGANGANDPPAGVVTSWRRRWVMTGVAWYDIRLE